MLYDPNERMQLLDFILNEETEIIEDEIEKAKQQNNKKQLEELKKIQKWQNGSTKARFWFFAISFVVTILIYIAVLCSVKI